MKRAAHRHAGDGTCSRCGLLIRFGNGECPPGFWMTEAESNVWSRLPTDRRYAFENDCKSRGKQR